jgi:hypothetical protein
MRKVSITSFCCSASVLLTMVLASGVRAQQSEADVPQPGTVITMQNWQQYKNSMQEGLQALFSGKYFWKFPADFRMEIGPTHDYPMPKQYLENTEKYSKLVKIVDLPDGGHSIKGYVAGLPFPTPSGPLKGWEILVNSWFEYVPHITCNPNNKVFLLDRFGNMTTETTATIYREFSFVSDPGVPAMDPSGSGIYYAEYTRVLQPEQSRYTTQLTLYYTDAAKSEDLFLFIPALRRTLRLSAASRCSPFVGTDFIQDDVKQLFNGGIVRFGATLVGEPNILAITVADEKASSDMTNYYPMLFPGPKVGKWEVRPTYLLDVRRIPAQRKGYCIGKRMLYVDKQQLTQSWADLYDENMKYWKSISFQQIAHDVPGVGPVMYTGDYLVAGWDQQNSHASGWITNPPFGTNQQCANLGGINYTDAKLYSSVSGLSSIMQ